MTILAETHSKDKMLNPVTPYLYIRISEFICCTLKTNKRIKTVSNTILKKNFKKTNRCKDIVDMFSFVIGCERDKVPFNIVCPVFPNLEFFVSLFCQKFLFFHRKFFLVITMCA